MTINCKGQLIDLSKPKVMGILNLTPNSFFDGGKYLDEAAIVTQVQKMLSEGATFIDIGAYSSKPNAEFVSVEEELARIVPVVELLVQQFPAILISIDTFRSEVAAACIQKGAALINDISAGKLDESMLGVIAKHKLPYVMMHMKGTPQTMQSLATYEDVVKEVMFYFSERINAARKLGINDVIVDPGFGFAKTLKHNYEIMQNLEFFSILELPILVGISRKSMIYKLLETTPNEALNGTSVLNTIALQKGAQILRVHDVKEAQECIKIFTQLK